MFTVVFSSMLFALLWWGMGRYKLTRIVQFMPDFVVSGFIASVGYMIMLKASGGDSEMNEASVLFDAIFQFDFCQCPRN